MEANDLQEIKDAAEIFRKKDPGKLFFNKCGTSIPGTLYYYSFLETISFISVNLLGITMRVGSCSMHSGF
jgi:hypothetical protein